MDGSTAHDLLPEPIFPTLPPGRSALGPGYDPRHFTRTASGVYVASTGHSYLLIARGDPPAPLFESEDRETANWIDFTIELIVGIVGLALGLTIGRKGYKALKPLVARLWGYPAFRERTKAVGRHAIQGDPLAAGWALAGLWVYLWANHRRDLIAAIWQAVRQELTFGALLVALVRWTARLIGGGIIFIVELGAMIVPLGSKLLR
jgi:hypothetical protein